MPPRTRTPAKAKNDAPTILEHMAQEVEELDSPPEYPPGVPEFKTLLVLRPRSRRATFKREYAEIARRVADLRKRQEAMLKMKAESDEQQYEFLNVSADADELCELIESALRLVTVDPEAFDAWAMEASDEELQQAWNAYQVRMQPGEASSSAS
jgi:hypothetical protein